jgi:hypothetical protein
MCINNEQTGCAASFKLAKDFLLLVSMIYNNTTPCFQQNLVKGL